MWWADVQRYLSNKYTAESAGEKKMKNGQQMAKLQATV